MASWRFKLFLLLVILILPLSGCGDLESELASLTMSPTSSTIGVNQSVVFTAIGKDSMGFIVTTDPTWSVTGNIGTINSTGLFTAGDIAGSGTVVATYDNTSASANVTVTETGWLVGTLSNAYYGTTGIKVYLDGFSTLFDFSDSNGQYEISDIPAGSYNAVTLATAVFQSASWEVTISRGQTTTQSFALELQPGIPTTTTTLFEPII